MQIQLLADSCWTLANTSIACGVLTSPPDPSPMERGNTNTSLS